MTALYPCKRIDNSSEFLRIIQNDDGRMFRYADFLDLRYSHLIDDDTYLTTNWYVDSDTVAHAKFDSWNEYGSGSADRCTTFKMVHSKYLFEDTEPTIVIRLDVENAKISPFTIYGYCENEVIKLYEHDEFGSSTSDSFSEYIRVLSITGGKRIKYFSVTPVKASIYNTKKVGPASASITIHP